MAGGGGGGVRRGGRIGCRLKECGLVTYHSKHISLSRQRSFVIRAFKCSSGVRLLDSYHRQMIFGLLF